MFFIRRTNSPQMDERHGSVVTIGKGASTTDAVEHGPSLNMLDGNRERRQRHGDPVRRPGNGKLRQTSAQADNVIWSKSVENRPCSNPSKRSTTSSSAPMVLPSSRIGMKAKRPASTARRPINTIGTATCGDSFGASKAASYTYTRHAARGCCRRTAPDASAGNAGSLAHHENRMDQGRRRGVWRIPSQDRRNRLQDDNRVHAERREFLS